MKWITKKVYEILFGICISLKLRKHKREESNRKLKTIFAFDIILVVHPLLLFEEIKFFI